MYAYTCIILMYFIFQRQFHLLLTHKILINFIMNHLFINTFLIISVNYLSSIKPNGLAFINPMLITLIEYYPQSYIQFSMYLKLILINFKLILLILIGLMSLG